MAKRHNRQLFSKKLDIDILKKVMKAYKIKKLNQHVFSRESLAEIGIEERVNEIKDDLKKYYMNCKANIYLDNFSVSRSVVVLRQVLKEFGYKIISKERYKDRKKYISYIIELANPLTEVDLVIIFD